MAKDNSKKDQELDLPAPASADEAPEDWDLKSHYEAAREARIGKTAERILLSYAGSKPGNFLKVEFAQEIRNVALVLNGEKPEAEPKPEAEANTEGELDLDAG